MILLLGIVMVAVILILVLFLVGARYRWPPKPERGVSFVKARLAAGKRLSFLAPKVMLIAEKERIVDVFLAGLTSDYEVGKLFLVDLAEVEALWRVLLFLGLGGLFLSLS